MNKQFLGDLDQIQTPEQIYDYLASFVLSEFTITTAVTWKRDVRVGPSNILYIFSYDTQDFVLAYDDFYPSVFGMRHTYDDVERVAGDDKIVRVTTPDDMFLEGVTGAFRLYRIRDMAEFNEYVGVLVEEQEEWQASSGGKADIAREIVTLARLADVHEDAEALGALGMIVQELQVHDIDTKQVSVRTLHDYVDALHAKHLIGDARLDEDVQALEVLERDVFQGLSRAVQHSVRQKNYEAKHLGERVRLILATYVHIDSEDSRGSNVPIIFKDGALQLRDGQPLSAELKAYFNAHSDITQDNVEFHVPETLGEYRLVQGSVSASTVFERELDYLTV